MGALTAAQIISEGQLLAGRDDLSARALSWLNTFLRSQYLAWPWPFLFKRLKDVSLTAGTATLTLGAGSGGESLPIQQVRDPVKMRNSTYTLKSLARIRQLVDGQPVIDPEYDEALRDPNTTRGIPSVIRVRASNSTYGEWTLYFTPIPDRDLLLTFDYIILPATITDTSSIPVYPNDETLIHRVYARTLRYAGDLEAAAMADEEVRNMTVNDRMKFGGTVGTGDILQVDPSVYR